ncbi:MAG TPA: EamA family transporter [Desulfobulbaceae bacterium]|nr:EamA family transporter [Desulfobulbaceae bacterium]
MNILGIVTAILAGLFMGTMGVFSRKTGLDAEVITFFRLFFGAAFLTLLLFVTRRLRLLLVWPTWPVLVNGLMLAGFIIFYIQAMYLTSMAMAIMVLYLAPLVASVYAHFFLDERLNLPSVVLICTALFGFAMMMEFKLDFSSGTNHVLGLGFAALGLCCYSAFILINRTIASRIHVFTRTFYQLLAGALCMVPFFLSDFPEISGTNWLWLVGAGFIPGFLGILCAVIALERLPAATFGTLAYFEPIFVVVLGWAIFGERLNTMQLTGCLFILASGSIKGYLAAQNGRFKNRQVKEASNGVGDYAERHKSN